MKPNALDNLRIDPADKRRPTRPLWIIFLFVFAIIGGAAYFTFKKGAERRVMNQDQATNAATASATTGTKPGENATTPASAPAARPDGTNDSILTVSGYIINKERIELSPHQMGFVKWIGVKKGDAVTNGQVVVLLEDTEQKARVREAEGRLRSTKTSLERAEIAFKRVNSLTKDKLESAQVFDDARLAVDAARATVQEVEGQLDLAKTYLDWTIIRSPIDGVVLEKLVDPNELVVPQSFGGTRGPSTALIALADPKQLQVELDLNESDLPKVFRNQLCRVSPEAYPDKVYEGWVAEIAPEANRIKGTLQVKVQIKNPDQFLTPELSAKVDFLQKSGQESVAHGK